MSIYSLYNSYDSRDYFSKYKKQNNINSSSLSNVYRDLMNSEKKASPSYSPPRSLSGVDMRSNYHYSNNNDESKNDRNYDRQTYKNTTPLQNPNQFNYSSLTNKVTSTFLNNNSREQYENQLYSSRDSFRNRSPNSRENNALNNNSNNINTITPAKNFYDTIANFGNISQNKSYNNKFTNINRDNQRNLRVSNTDTININNKSNIIYKNYFGENKSPNIYNNNANNNNYNNYNNNTLRYSFDFSNNSQSSLSQGFNVYNRENNNTTRSVSLSNKPVDSINNNYYNRNVNNYSPIKNADFNRMSNKILANNNNNNYNTNYNNNYNTNYNNNYNSNYNNNYNSNYNNNYNSNYNIYNNNTSNNNLYNSEERSSSYSSQDTFPKICSYGVHTMAGTNCYGLTKTNQDSYLIKIDKNSNSENEYTFGIFDGHGNHGHFVSQAIKQFFTNLPPYNNPTQSSFFPIFKDLSNNINNSQYFESVGSGSTVVIVHITFPNIFCVNCGDSRAILITKNNELILLSRDHKPEIPEEKMRIEGMGGRVDKIFGKGPFRVWYKNEDYPGLAMSRSIGDQLAHRVGVSDEPEVKVFDANEINALAIVVASDGVWEFMSNEEVKNLVMNFQFSKDASACARNIVEKARDVWRKTGYNIDDITAVVAFFE